jgi:type VI secretion system protein ImpF
MAEALRDRLVPSLLDRLTDDDIGTKVETRDRRLMTVPQLRSSVLRDISCLFNVARLGVDHIFDDFPEVKRSVLNYGLPSLSGKCISGTDMKELEREFKQAIINFEPRLIPDSVIVKAQVNNKDLDLHNIVSFNIRAQLWAQPAPVELTLQTDLDLENGQCKVTEGGRR